MVAAASLLLVLSRVVPRVVAHGERSDDPERSYTPLGRQEAAGRNRRAASDAAASVPATASTDGHGPTFLASGWLAPIAAE